MSMHGWVDEIQNFGDHIEGEWPVPDKKFSERMLAQMQEMIAELQPPLVRVSPFVSPGKFIHMNLPGKRRIILIHKNHIETLRAGGYEIEQESERKR